MVNIGTLAQHSCSQVSRRPGFNLTEGAATDHPKLFSLERHWHCTWHFKKWNHWNHLEMAPTNRFQRLKMLNHETRIIQLHVFLHWVFLWTNSLHDQCCRAISYAWSTMSLKGVPFISWTAAAASCGPQHISASQGDRRGACHGRHRKPYETHRLVFVFPHVPA